MADKTHRQSEAQIFDAAIRLGAVALLVYWAITLIRPFTSIALWSIVLTVALYPAYKWLVALLGRRRRLAAVVLTATCLAVALGPILWLSLGLLDGLQSLLHSFDLAMFAPSPPPESVRQWPFVGGAVYEFWHLASTNLDAALARIAPQLKPLGGAAFGALAETGISIAILFVGIVIAGFLFPRKRNLTRGIRKLARRLADDRGDRFLELATDTIRAVASGVVGVSVLQATLAGFAIAAAAVPGGSILVSLILFLGLAQVGATIVTVPLVIWAWVNLGTVQALLFTAYMVPVGLLDNILRPILFGRSLNTPVLIILIGVMGGTVTSGVTGLFLGPIILAVIWEMLVAWVGNESADSQGVNAGLRASGGVEARE